MSNELRSYRGRDNPNYKDGRRKTRLYRIYHNMLNRCTNPKSGSYNRYGGRGIRVCEAWVVSFEAFRDWAITNRYTNDLTIDRIDNDGDYTPENCRWVTIRQQALNRSCNHLIQIDGVSKPLGEWSRIYGINSRTVRDRIIRGWNEVTAVTVPVDPRWSH